MTPPPGPPAVVLLPVTGALASTTLEALSVQTVRPEAIVRIGGGEEDKPLPGVLDAATLGEALRLGRGASDWIWLLDAGTAPEAPALARLLDARARLGGGGAVALLASRVIDAAGRLDRRSLPIPEIRRADRVLTALAQRLLAIRAARYGSLLVDATALEVVRRPRAGGMALGDLTWTARMLRDRFGVLVPDSVVVRAAAGRDSGGRLGGAAALDAWRLVSGLEPAERVSFMAHLARDLAARRAGRE